MMFGYYQLAFVPFREVSCGLPIKIRELLTLNALKTSGEKPYTIHEKEFLNIFLHK